MNTLEYSPTEELEKQLEGEREKVELAERIMRLTDNADFRFVIREQFLVQECARFVRESVNPQLPSEERSDALAKAQAAGHLKQWLNVQIQMGRVAAKTIRDIEQEIERVRLEDHNADEPMDEED